VTVNHIPIKSTQKKHPKTLNIIGRYKENRWKKVYIPTTTQLEEHLRQRQTVSPVSPSPFFFRPLDTMHLVSLPQLYFRREIAKKFNVHGTESPQ
jgi:hypothetical protein